MTPDEPGRAGTPDEFLAMFNTPAPGDPAEEMDEWVRFMVCPKCSASYPDFHSPKGSLGTLCDNCGWASDDPENWTKP